MNSHLSGKHNVVKNLQKSKTTKNLLYEALTIATYPLLWLDTNMNKKCYRNECIPKNGILIMVEPLS